MHATHDVVIRGGTIYDGSGGTPFAGDLAIDGDRIVKVGTVDQRGRTEIYAAGLAVSPGFINMLSWATTSLIADGLSQSDTRQGVTLEVFGEGWSLARSTTRCRREQTGAAGRHQYDISWTTLAEALDTIVRARDIANIASFIGAATARITSSPEDRRPSAEELTRMRALVESAMRDGALGVDPR